jgi:putative transposase
MVLTEEVRELETVVKTVKQHSYSLDNDALKELKLVGERYRRVKNYVYSRYSGINSIVLIKRDRDIRDEWVKTKFAEQWKLPARYWKLALSEAISNIKSGWSNIKLRVKSAVNKNKKLSKEELHYIRYILKADELYQRILQNKSIQIPEAIKLYRLDTGYLNSLIRRLTRKYKGKVPYSRTDTFSIDTGLYSYDDGQIRISSTVKGKRVSVKLKDRNVYDRTMTVKFKDDGIELHCPLKIAKKKHGYQNVIGIDKGYRTLFAVSSQTTYGENLNSYLSEETDRLKEVNSARNRFYALKNRYLSEGNYTVARNIELNNLGKKKYNRRKDKYDQRVKSYINHSINRLIKNEEPGEIVMEDLSFASWNDRFPKSVKRKLSRWIKGYIKSRLEFKCEYNSIKYTYINPAYTSQICSSCDIFGIRKNELFFCNTCGEMDSDINASLNILKRRDDSEIKLHTDYRKVKEILQARVDKLGLK